MPLIVFNSPLQSIHLKNHICPTCGLPMVIVCTNGISRLPFKRYTKKYSHSQIMNWTDDNWWLVELPRQFNWCYTWLFEPKVRFLMTFHSAKRSACLNVCYLVRLESTHLKVLVQKCHHSWMLATSGGQGPVPECLSVKRSPSLNVGYQLQLDFRRGHESPEYNS